MALVFKGKSISSKKYFYAYIRTLTRKTMLGFHSQNVLQILENMKPIIFRINATDDGSGFTFNKVEGMTVTEAFNTMMLSGYTKEGSEPVIPILRVSLENVGFGYAYSMDVIPTVVVDFTSSTKPTSFRLTSPMVPRDSAGRLESKGSLEARGSAANSVLIDLVINSNGTVTVNQLED